MLDRLTVRNLGIIEDVTLDPGPGLVALTGETGAGKSLLVGSLDLIAGGRASADLVRTGAETLRVQGWFRPPFADRLRDRLDAAGIELDPDETLVIRREVSAEGRSRAWINDTGVTAGTVREIAADLLSIHGQHEQHGLADPSVQRRFVDEHAGHSDLRARVSDAYGVWRRDCDVVVRMEGDRKARRDRLDTIAYQLDEIDAVDPQPGEDEDLRARRTVLRNAARLSELATAALQRLEEGESPVVDQLARAERELEEMSELGMPLRDAAGRIGEALVHAQETVRELQDLVAELVHDPGELDDVETRLHRLEQLMLKYGSPIDTVLDHRRDLVDERDGLQNLDEDLETARRREAASLDAYDHAATELQRSREASARELVDAVSEILDRLNMGGTSLEVRWHARPDPASPLWRDGRTVAFDDEGVEECELLIAPNPGEELRPMAKIASGGELSRLHLALRTAIRGRRSAALTLLFDEVDSGLGGATAAALGNLLSDVAATDQVLVVTHLPQVAARASAHLFVEKTVDGRRTRTRVTPLSKDARVDEVARMLAGDEIQDSARRHARALLDER